MKTRLVGRNVGHLYQQITPAPKPSSPYWFYFCPACGRTFSRFGFDAEKFGATCVQTKQAVQVVKDPTVIPDDSYTPRKIILSIWDCADDRHSHASKQDAIKCLALQHRRARALLLRRSGKKIADIARELGVGRARIGQIIKQAEELESYRDRINK